jgi:hypothetical protein
MKKFFSKRWWLAISIIIALAIGLVYGIPAIINMWQTEQKPTTSDNTTVNTLTVDEKDFWKLNLNDALLNKLYEEAHNVAILDIPDAKLSEFDIDVFPYSPISKVRITYCFYSNSADRERDYVFSDKLKISLERDISGIEIVNRVTFESFPWITTQEWMSSIRKACEKIGSLTPDYATGYLVWVVNWPKLTWHININDSVNWHWTLFNWYGQGDPVLVKQFGEDITISKLIYYP